MTAEEIKKVRDAEEKAFVDAEIKRKEFIVVRPKVFRFHIVMSDDVNASILAEQNRGTKLLFTPLDLKLTRHRFFKAYS